MQKVNTFTGSPNEPCERKREQMHSAKSNTTVCVFCSSVFVVVHSVIIKVIIDTSRFDQSLKLNGFK